LNRPVFDAAAAKTIALVDVGRLWHERRGAGGDDFEATVFDVDPETPIGSWKEAWESVKRKTKVEVRFHDLRHTCVTRMPEGAVPLSVVASILGWSPATTARMAKRYGHIGQPAMRHATAVLEKAARPKRGVAKKATGTKGPGSPAGTQSRPGVDPISWTR
jgi:integrase